MPGANRPSPSTASASTPVIAANSVARRPIRPGGMLRALAHRRHRRDARGAQRRAEARPAPSRTMPTASDTTIVRVANTVPVARQVDADRREHARQPLGQAEPAARPITEADRADRERLGHDRAQHLAPVAPSARSSASSRERWATVIDSVL